MLALAISEGIRLCMSHHVYCLGDRIFLQLSGGPIGLELTGAVSRPFMKRWDKLYLDKVKNAGINIVLYKRYVDDSNQIAVVPPAGSVYDKVRNKVEVKQHQHQQQESDISEDERLVRILLEIANTVIECIKMEGDTPSRNGDGKLPILDMKTWTDNTGTILYQHYEKPVSS